MTESLLRDQMVAIARSFFQRGYATGSAGNLSVLLDDGTILATPTGSCLGDLSPETLSHVNMDGVLLSGDKPSKEVGFHLMLYRNNPQCRAVVHLHCHYLTAISCLQGVDPGNTLPACTPYVVMRVGEVPLAPYFRPGDPEIGHWLAHRAMKHKAFLLANHGPVVTGSSLRDAADNLEEMEASARLFFTLRNSAVNYLDDEQIAVLRGMS
ncbi:ribulose-5-phosphate 4-epimerase/fuculose-1-phosphate aldolase [Raoultella sp. BIGb0138]|uniref:3-oxo-tetronate 4-phosphate decarboxylase n=1 Tax=Raoultella sp. BIGb0138 TaxID=2485115 RepID=UPI00104BFD38|nr:aldolase [Raoultella sp. BIGb0138]TCW08549.1 ribulose-5-phosphate 4-epimerase/fuculose-1-phosphate aldolase [Raoultella sp. BIGb0138]